MIECQNLVKIYKSSETEVVALQGLDLKVDPGEMIAIIGNSGSGKSTLLNMLGGLDKPSAGKLLVGGKELFQFTDKELNHYRTETVGFVWQNHARNLIPYMSAADNVMMPMAEKNRKVKEQWAHELLDRVGLYKRRNHKLTQLSGGEQQRVAIAISLSNRPKILLADEPTGAVDSATADIILDIFKDFNEHYGVTVVIVTHDMSLSRKVDRIVAIRDGQVSSEFLKKKDYRNELNSMDDVDFGEDEESHMEMVVLDKYGRLQLPKDIAENLKEKGETRLLVSTEEEKIILSLPEKDLENP